MDEDQDAVLRPTVAGALAQYWPLFFLIVVLSTVLGAGYAATRPGSATASAALVVVDPERDRLFGARDQAPTYVADQAAAIGLGVTLARASEHLESTGTTVSADDLEEGLAVTNPDDTNLIRLQYRAATPELALKGVEAIITAYRELLVEQVTDRARRTGSSIDRAIADIDARLADPVTSQESRSSLLAARQDLQARRVDVQVPADGASIGIEWYSPPSTPARERRPVLRTGILFGVAAVLPATTICYMLAQRRRQIRGPHEPETVLGVPLLGEVPTGKGVASGAEGPVPGYDRQAFALLMACLMTGDHPPRSIAVVPASDKMPGPPTVAMLAVAAATGGSRVLAIDSPGNMAGPSTLLLPRHESRAGVAPVLTGRSPADEGIRTSHLSDDLDVLPSTEPAGLTKWLATRAQWERLLDSVKDRYALILIDVPAVSSADGLVVLAAADAVVLVVGHGLPIDVLEEHRRRLAVLGVTPIGYLYVPSTSASVVRQRRRSRGPMHARDAARLSSDEERGDQMPPAVPREGNNRRLGRGDGREPGMDSPSGVSGLAPRSQP